MNEMAQKYYDTSRPAYFARYGFVDEIVDLKALRGGTHDCCQPVRYGAGCHGVVAADATVLIGDDKGAARPA